MVITPDNAFVAVVLAVSSTVSPLLLSMLNSRNRRKEKVEDYARQDAVATQAKEAARLLVERQDAAASKAAEAAQLLATNTAKVAETAERANDKLDVIHTLVNSNMTTALQSEYDAIVREAAMMQEVIELKIAAGSQPTIKTLASLTATKAKIIELGTALADRLSAAGAVLLK